MQSLLKHMQKRRTVLGAIRIFLTGLVGFTLIDWLEAQAMKNQSKSNYNKDKMAESVNNKNEPNLHLAIKDKDKILIKDLIDKGADVQANDSEGATPLHYAASFGDEEIINLLVEQGADIKATGKNYKTPINWAIESKNSENVDILKSLLPK